MNDRLSSFLNGLRRRLVGAVLGAGTCLLFVAGTAGQAQAQATVAPSCPAGYQLQGSQCVAAAPVPTCPAGYVFSDGQCVVATVQPAPPAVQGGNGPWVIVTRSELGITTALELSGARICVIVDDPSEAAIASYFTANRMEFDTVVYANLDETLYGYGVNTCDVVPVPLSQAGNALASLMQPGSRLYANGAHMILPEQIAAGAVANPPAAVAPKPKPPATSAVKPKPPVPLAPKPPVRVAPAPPRTNTLARDLQAELKRVGCLRGPVDGIWGRGSTAAMQNFLQWVGVGYIDARQPTQEGLAMARGEPYQVCNVNTQADPQPPYDGREQAADELEACNMWCERNDIQCGNDLEASWDGVNDHHFDICTEEFNSCSASCSFEAGYCYTFADGGEVCP